MHKDTHAYPRVCGDAIQINLQFQGNPPINQDTKKTGEELRLLASKHRCKECQIENSTLQMFY